MIHAVVRMMMPAERLSEVTRILGPMAERIRAERGCLACHFYRDALDRTIIAFEQTWASEADLERHLHSQDCGHLLLVMEMAAAPPEVRFDTVSGSTGIETIKQARG